MIYTHIFYVYLIYIVLTYLNTEKLLPCISTYKSLNLQSKHYLFVLLNYNRYNFTSINRDDISGSFIPISYHSYITSIINTAFTETSGDSFGSSFHVSHIYENAYVASKLYQNAVQETKKYTDDEWPETDYVRLTLPGIKLTSPSGLIEILDSNYVNRSSYLMEVESDSYIQINPLLGTTETYEPIPFSSSELAEKNRNLKDETILDYPKAYQIVNYSMCGVSFILITCCLIFTIKYRNTRLIKDMSTLYYYCLLFALYFSTGSILFFGFSHNDNSTICINRVSFTCLSLSLLSSILMAKVKKYHSLRKNKVRKIKMSLLYILKVFVIGFIIPLILDIIYVSVDAKHEYVLSKEETNYLVNSYYRICSQNDTITYIIYIIRFIIAAYFIFYYLIAIKYAIQVRKVANEFKDTYILLTTIIVTFIILLVLFLLEFSMELTPDGLMLFRGIAYPIIIIIILSFQYLPKFIFIFSTDDAVDITDSLTREMSKADNISTTIYLFYII